MGFICFEGTTGLFDMTVIEMSTVNLCFRKLHSGKTLTRNQFLICLFVFYTLMDQIMTFFENCVTDTQVNFLDEMSTVKQHYMNL